MTGFASVFVDGVEMADGRIGIFAIDATTGQARLRGTAEQSTTLPASAGGGTVWALSIGGNSDSETLYYEFEDASGAVVPMAETSTYVANGFLGTVGTPLALTNLAGGCSGTPLSASPPPAAPPTMPLGPSRSSIARATSGNGYCPTPPCAAPLLGDVGRTTVGGTDARSGATFLANENIYGPFEAGFQAQQNHVLRGLGCTDPALGHVAGGFDTRTAEAVVASGCGISLPRVDGSEYVSLLDECGGHTREYHFHERYARP